MRTRFVVLKFLKFERALYRHRDVLSIRRCLPNCFLLQSIPPTALSSGPYSSQLCATISPSGL